MRGEFVDLLSRLSSLESPTDEPGTQAAVQAVLRSVFEALGFRVRFVPGRGNSGGHLYARPARRDKGGPAQLLIGHSDTVWPVGTLATMPVKVEDGRLYGPGTLDMKGGLTQIVFALRALRELELEPSVTPVVFVNSDEETGSPDSKPMVRRLARRVCRTFVLEPALGMEGKVKTGRKGVGRFTVSIRGRSAHAGLEPEAGASAILELSHVIQTLHGMADPERGITVNVGVIDGGSRANVVAARARAEIDVRVRTVEDGRRIEEAILGIGSTVPGVTLTVDGSVIIPPMERTERNLKLWERTRDLGEELGLELDHALAGGGSDGNTTSQFTATLDGLGCVGDGAHADHEHIEIDASLDRCALLARLLLAPAEGRE
jgi:glutamate carboxypeptidase